MSALLRRRAPSKFLRQSVTQSAGSRACNLTEPSGTLNFRSKSSMRHLFWISLTLLIAGTVSCSNVARVNTAPPVESAGVLSSCPLSNDVLHGTASSPARARFTLEFRRGRAIPRSLTGYTIERTLVFDRLGITDVIVRSDSPLPHDDVAYLSARSNADRVRTIGFARAHTAKPYLVNDPYFIGLPGTAAPFFETAAVPGEWDMHVIGVANAWGYALPGNSVPPNANALGRPDVPIAVVDSGADVLHPELRGKIVRAQCYMNGTSSDFVTDEFGHGTPVAGVAAADTNNGIGLVGVGFRSPLMIYKVIGAQGVAFTADVAAAINDAVAHGARVVNLSLGSTSDDPTEHNAVENAIASGVVVVASTGNEGVDRIDFPARDPGVIAVGSSELNEKTRAITEAVASYSNFGTSGNWGLVAPGGSADVMSDYLQSIYTIASSQAPGSSDLTCTPDPVYGSGIDDCRTKFFGTSIATPHVAGAAALLLSVGVPASNVAQLLCRTADDIGDSRQGCGRLNVYRAMAIALHDPNPP